MASWRSRITSAVFWTGLAGLAVWFAVTQLQSPPEPKTEFPLTGEFIAVEGVRLYVQAKGEGRPLVFLHAFPANSESYRALLDRPWSGRRLIVPDFPGLGRSGGGAGRTTTPEDLALTVKLLLDKLGIKDADLVGNDLGGGVALVLISQYPNLFKRAVLLAPDSSAGLAAEAEPEGWRLPVLGEIWAAAFSARGYIRGALEQAWPSGERGWESRVEQYADPVDTPAGRRGLLKLERGRRDFDYRPFEERLRNPVLLIWGERDRVVTAERGRALAAKLTSSEFELLPERGHLLPDEAPEALYAAIGRFLKVPGTASVGTAAAPAQAAAEAPDAPRPPRKRRFALPTPSPTAEASPPESEPAAAPAPEPPAPAAPEIPAAPAPEPSSTGVSAP